MSVLAIGKLSSITNSIIFSSHEEKTRNKLIEFYLTIHILTHRKFIYRIVSSTGNLSVELLVLLECMMKGNRKIVPDDELVDYISLHVQRSLLYHAYVFPFLIAYSVWLFLWVNVYGVSEFYEQGLLVLAVIGVAQVLVCLFCHWSVHVCATLTCTKVEDMKVATLAKVVPLPNNGSPELVPLEKLKDEHGIERVWFMFQKTKYVWESMERKQFEAVHYPIDLPFRHYAEAKGIQSPELLELTRQKYGDNNLVMDVPGFKELFKERATAPFFVFQIFCVGLWSLDDYVYYSLFTLVMLVVFECTLVHQTIRNMQEIRKMGNKPYSISVYRFNKWRQVLTSDLVPGDVVSLSRYVSVQISVENIKYACFLISSSVMKMYFPNKPYSLF